MNQGIDNTMGADLPATEELIERLDLDKVEEIVRSKINKYEAEEFFKDGPTNVSLYHCENEPVNFDDEFLVDEETYADALIHNMREATNQKYEEIRETHQAEVDAERESLKNRLKLMYGEGKEEFEEYPHDHLVTQESPYFLYDEEMLITIYDCEKCKENWQVYRETDYDKSVTQIDAASIGSSLLEEVDQKCWACEADCKHMKMSAVYRLDAEEEGEN